MTARQKLDAIDQREALFAAAGWRSVVSGRPLREGVPQLAHRVAKTRANLEKWGPGVIHHPLNLVPVLDLRENDAVNIGFDREKAHDLMQRIIRVTTGREPEPNMSEEYRLLREEFEGRYEK